jgi:hypothetical protein
LKKYSNKLFQKLKKQFGIENIKKVNVVVPAEVKQLLNEEIVETEYGITFKCWEDKIGPSKHSNKSIVEDNVNHFHVDCDAIPNNEETAFKLGIKTVILLYEKFKNEGFSKMQISFSFHTIEMSKQMNKDLNIENEDDHFFGDRISFNRVREGEKIRANLEDFKYNSMLILETE